MEYLILFLKKKRILRHCLFLFISRSILRIGNSYSNIIIWVHITIYWIKKNIGSIFDRNRRFHILCKNIVITKFH